MEPELENTMKHAEAYLQNDRQPGEAYLEMYLHLFRAVTRAIEDIRDGRPWDAERELAQAQQDTEELYIEAPLQP